MRRKVISDIIVSKKSIRQIPLSNKKNNNYAEFKKEVVDLEENRNDLKHYKIKRATEFGRRPLNPRLVIWSLAGICVLSLIFGISIIFSSATVYVNPRTEQLTFTDELYVAKMESSNVTDLSFEIIKTEQAASEVVSTKGEKDVSFKSSGSVIIYNNYSTVPQRLISNTRLEANSGKTYRISSSVVVPGVKKIDGKNVPGSVEALIYADEPGENYNMKLSDLTGDFKIPGFKGDVRYAGFYARLKSDLVGGFVGKQRIVNPEQRKEAEEKIKAVLREQLLKELSTIKPENFLFFNDAYSISYNNLPDVAVDTDKVKINIEGSLSGVIFNNSKLSSYLAKEKKLQFEGFQTEFVPSSSLVVTLVSPDNTDFAKSKTLQLKFSGDAMIKFVFDANALKKDLLGRKKAEIGSLEMKYKETIKSIKVVFRPIWTRYIPDDLGKIKIIESI